MRRQISVTHPVLLEKFKEITEEKGNVSKYIEEAVLYYMDFKTHDYITRDEFLHMLAKINFAPKNSPIDKKDISSIINL